MKVVVTGSSGFVGTNLCQRLKANNWDVVGIDYASSDLNKFIRYRLGSGNYIVKEQITAINPDVVIHLASESHVDRSISGPDTFIENNVVGTLELFEIFKNTQTRIVLMSTDEVGACLESGSFFENGQPFHCGSVYSASKGAQELLAQAYIKTFGMQIVTVRCVNIFGGNQSFEKFIPKCVFNVVAGLPIPVYGSGMQCRQWVPVQSVCDSLEFIASSTHIPHGSVLHLGGTTDIPNVLIANSVMARLRRGEIEHIADRPGHDERYRLGVSSDTLDFGVPQYDPVNFIHDLGAAIDVLKVRASQVRHPFGILPNNQSQAI